MNLQRFLYTSLPGRGFVELASNEGIPTRLKEALRQPQAGTPTRGFEAGLGVTFWATNSSVVCTYLERMQDEHRRYFVASHSVCMPLNDYRKIAPHFDDAILAPLREGIVDVPTGGLPLDPLVVPQPSLKETGVKLEDLEVLNQYISEGKSLESLFACLFDSKDFTLSIQGDSEWEAIKIAVALLKLAATVGVDPQAGTGLATFSQARGIPTLYGSKVLPDNRLRILSELSAQSGNFSRKAQSVAQRLVPEIQDENIAGINQAIRAGDARARTPSTSASKPLPSEKPEKPLRPAAGFIGKSQRQGPEPSTGSKYDPELKAWEEDLTKWQEELEGKHKGLDEWEKGLDGWEKNLARDRESLEVEKKVLNEQREELRKESEELGLRKTNLKESDEFWQLYVRLDSLMQRRKLGDLKGNSIKALGNLMDDLRRKLRGRSRDTQTRVLKVLNEREVKDNLSKLSHLGNLSTKYEELKAEESRQRKSK